MFTLFLEGVISFSFPSYSLIIMPIITSRLMMRRGRRCLSANSGIDPQAQMGGRMRGGESARRSSRIYIFCCTRRVIIFPKISGAFFFSAKSSFEKESELTNLVIHL